MKISKVVLESVDIFEGELFSDILWFEAYFRFLDFKGSFLSLIFEFWKFRKLFWNQNGHIWGGLFSDIFLFEDYFIFLDFKGSFFSLIFEFWKFWELFWNQWAYLGGVCFLTFCDLRLILGFWILRGHFLVWFLSFENSESCFGISGHIWGGSVFWHFVIWSFFSVFGF